MTISHGIANDSADTQCAVADEGERQVRVEHRRVVAEQPRQAAHRGQRAERHDERRQAQERDQHAVAQADDEAGQQCRDNAEIAERLRHQQADDGRRGEDRPDRKIDAAGQDHERHAGAEHRVDRGLLGDDRQVLPGQEPALAGEVDPADLDQYAEDDQHRQHADRADERRASVLLRASAGRSGLTLADGVAHAATLSMSTPVASAMMLSSVMGMPVSPPTSPRGLAFAHHHDAVGDADDLRQFGADDQHRRAVLREFVDDAVDLRLGADIDAARRFVQDQHLRLGLQQARQQHLLLVAAGQGADRRLRPGHADVHAP